jgi:putative hemolysin
MADSGLWLLMSLALAALLVLSAFFSGAETAFFSLSRLQLSRMRESKDPVAGTILQVLATPHRFLTSALIGNTLVNVASATVATTVLLGVSERWGLELAVVIDTALVIIFGEIIPKTVAVSYPEGFSTTVARPVRTFMALASPVAAAAAALSRGVLRALGVRDTSLKLGFLTNRELHVLFDQLEQEKVISELETRMARNIFSFSTTPVQSVMTPRVDVVALSEAATPEEMVAAVKEARHSRVPVYSGTIDNTIGFVNAKEFLMDPSRGISAADVRPVIIVPENKRIDETFHEMQARRCPLVVVVNEYGEMMGIVTLEDLVEEIVGEIYDEFESEEAPLEKLSEGEYVVDGLISLEDLNDELDLDLSAQDSVTLNGLLCETLDRLPEEGDQVSVGPVTFTVMETDGRRCKRCRVAVETPEDTNDALSQ